MEWYLQKRCSKATLVDCVVLVCCSWEFCCSKIAMRASNRAILSELCSELSSVRNDLRKGPGGLARPRDSEFMFNEEWNCDIVCAKMVQGILWRRGTVTARAGLEGWRLKEEASYGNGK